VHSEDIVRGIQGNGKKKYLFSFLISNAKISFAVNGDILFDNIMIWAFAPELVNVAVFLISPLIYDETYNHL
jgi:hypothetical protein